MAKTTKKAGSKEPDSIYFLKILIYFVLGTIWIKYDGYVVFPLGLLIGILIAQKDHFAIDRKMEYAILLISAIIGLLAGGLYLVV
jgi:hypothetical protein